MRVNTLANQTDTDGRGGNTLPEVVGFMLDLVGYTACQPLYNKLRECCMTRPNPCKKNSKKCELLAHFKYA